MSIENIMHKQLYVYFIEWYSVINIMNSAIYNKMVPIRKLYTQTNPLPKDNYHMFPILQDTLLAKSVNIYIHILS